MAEEDRESLPSVGSTKASSEVSLVDELWCVLDPRASCLLLACLSPSSIGALNSCCADHREQFEIALFWLALHVLASFCNLIRRLQ